MASTCAVESPLSRFFSARRAGLWRITDREPRARLDGPGIEPCELVDEVLKGRPKVVDDVSGASSPVGWGMRYADAKQALSGVRIVLAEHRVHLLPKEQSEIRVQGLQVLACPVKAHIGIVE